MDSVLVVLGIIFPVFAVAVSGYLYARFRRGGTDLSLTDRVNLEIFTPALIFSVMSDADFDLLSYTSLTAAGVVVILITGVIAVAAARVMKTDVKTLVPPLMFNNSGNMGLPLAVFAFGEEGLAAATVLFIVENFMHFTFGSWILAAHFHIKPLIRLPMFWGAFLGIFVNLAGIKLVEPLGDAISMLGQISIPLLLFSLGARVAQTHVTPFRLAIVANVLNVSATLLVGLMLIPLFSLEGMQAAQFILFCALPPAVLNFMLAEQYGQEPDKVASIVLLGNVSSILVIPVVLYCIL
ncbi:AEC family transporter [Solemya elarraichensis gill symbiont]|uniref:Transporter n=1 Tax=Solemya elarraichensis gill symbiont TaxID=1918949 RepID=A0A1T2KY25_9GAMM|nr:AEC family transporter [Solemya elarraichensis gill symbiont]OOZ37767.1 hypothetical protein BOW52_10060 [Solemya elarraichensis gill symbiont]